MTRKHFEALAAAIREISDPAERVKAMNMVGAVCADANPRFDWGRFKKAATPTEAAP